jgi:hypothetical protein
MSDVPSTLLLLGPSGVVDEIDPPKDEHAKKRLAQALASGGYREVQRSEVEEQTTRHGGVILVMRKPQDAKPPRKVASKVADGDNDD